MEGDAAGCMRPLVATMGPPFKMLKTTTSAYPTTMKMIQALMSNARRATPLRTK
jgi:hypothetical protein